MKLLDLKKGRKVYYARIRAGGYWDGDFKAVILEFKKAPFGGTKVKIEYCSKKVWIDIHRLWGEWK